MKKNLFDQIDDLKIEADILHEKIQAYRQKNNKRWWIIQKKLEKLNKKIDKLESECAWSEEAIVSFQKFNIEGIEDKVCSRRFKYKNKTITLRLNCKVCGIPLPGKWDYVDKVLSNGDEIWRCGKCKYLYQDHPGNMFEYDNPPDSAKHTYYIIRNSDIKKMKKKIKTQKKSHVWYDIDQELYKGNLLKRWFSH